MWTCMRGADAPASVWEEVCGCMIFIIASRARHTHGARLCCSKGLEDGVTATKPSQAPLGALTRTESVLLAPTPERAAVDGSSSMAMLAGDEADPGLLICAPSRGSVIKVGNGGAGGCATRMGPTGGGDGGKGGECCGAGMGHSNAKE